MRDASAAAARVAQIPAPVGGWNARDPLPSMKPTDAVLLDNFIPGTGGVSLRGGTKTRNTGLPGAVNSLLRYFPASGAQRLFAVAKAVGVAGFFDVSAPGVAGAATVSGFASDAWQGVMFANPAGTFLVAASGQDAPQIFDGTSWKAMTIQTAQGYAYALDPTKLMAPAVFGNRLWFVERGTLHVWYLPLYQIQATGYDAATPPNRIQASDAKGQIPLFCAQVLDLASEFDLGGALVAFADWTRDGGQGSNDYAVLISSAGQAVMYTGTNPNDASSFGKVGKFRIPLPIGTRCVLRAGADLAILTQTGAVPLSSMLALSESEDDEVALTDKIRGAYKLALQVSGSAFGWEMAEYPKGSLVLVNVPSMGGVTAQYVMNVLTGAWCSFSGLPARTFGLIGDALVFGTPDGRVVQYDVGSSDDGKPIRATALPAFSNFRTEGRKRFLLAWPLYFGPVGYRPAIKVAVDYDTSSPPLPQGSIPPALTPWGSLWGSPWGTPIKPVNRAQSVRGLGATASVLVQVVSVNPFRLDHINVSFETGSYL